jgi:hypothetical protein
MFLLDNEREILLRPNSVKQTSMELSLRLNPWVDWFLVQGHPMPR